MVDLPASHFLIFGGEGGDLYLIQLFFGESEDDHQPKSSNPNEFRISVCQSVKDG